MHSDEHKQTPSSWNKRSQATHRNLVPFQAQPEATPRAARAARPPLPLLLRAPTPQRRRRHRPHQRRGARRPYHVVRQVHLRHRAARWLAQCQIHSSFKTSSCLPIICY